MSIENAVRNRALQLEQIGKAALNIKYPNEFELYVCALELTDSDGNTLKYFIFPVMPSSIDESIPQLTNVKKTLAGITTLSSPTFVPTDITLVGNFGRKFRVLLGTDLQDFVSAFSVNNNVTTESLLNGAIEFFDNRVKTGYGCIKVLQDMIEQSNQVDANGSKRLIFYNQALGNSYVVKATNLRFNQSQDSNMIWNYTLQLKSIAPLEAIKTKRELEQERFRLNTTGFVQKQVDNLVNSLTSVIATQDASLTSKYAKKWI